MKNHLNEIISDTDQNCSAATSLRHWNLTKNDWEIWLSFIGAMIPRWTPGWSPSPPTPRCRCWPARSSPLRCSNSPLECSPRLASCAAWTEWSHVFSLFLPVDGDFHHWFPSEAASFCAGVSSLNTSNTSDRFGLQFWYKSTVCDLVDWSGKKIFCKATICVSSHHCIRVLVRHRLLAECFHSLLFEGWMVEDDDDHHWWWFNDGRWW